MTRIRDKDKRKKTIKKKLCPKYLCLIFFISSSKNSFGFFFLDKGIVAWFEMDNKNRICEYT